MEKQEKIDTARRLADDFAERTGLRGTGGDIKRRYLWTDAFAVQNFFALAHLTGDEKYHELALKLIDEVHYTLGRFREDDEREGWISGLSDEEGSAHPTAGGLRIGKKEPERRPEEPFDNRQEWERDGQYFHYLTRWMTALIQASAETSDKRYAHWAAELAEAGHKFVTKDGRSIRMYWKMSTDLSRPLVESMGAHDPLEGAVLANSLQQLVPEKSMDLEPVIEDMELLCVNQDWSTTDPLGIGGLLLNIPRVLELKDADLPTSLLPGELYSDSLQGLTYYNRRNPADEPAYRRLAFRECGMSLGLRVIEGLGEELEIDSKEIDPYLPLAEELEKFWCEPENQKSPTWKDHLDINAVTLACSLTAGSYPYAYAVNKQ